MTKDYLRISGVVCPCGQQNLRVIRCGVASDSHDLFGEEPRRRPDLCYCSIACAKLDGWPWIPGMAGVADV
jgi:hypothetical protein